MHAYACISMSLCIEHSYPCLRVSTTGPDFGIWAPSPKPITFLFKSDRIGPFLGSAPPGPDFGIWAPSPKPITFLLKSYRIGPFPGSAPPGPDFGIWAPSPKPIKHSYPCIKHSYAYPCLCVSNISIDVLVYEPQLSMCLCIGHCVSAIPMCDMHSVTPVIHCYHVFGLLCVCLLVQYVCILFLVLLKVIVAGNIDGPIIVGCFCSLIAVQPSAARAQL